MAFPIEVITDDQKLYFYVHCNHVTYTEDRAVLKEAALCNTPKDGPNKSCEWEKYTTPEVTRNLRAREYKHGKTEFKNPEAFFVYSHIAGTWRQVHINVENTPIQSVQHKPIYNDPEIVGTPNNQSHSIVIGEKSSEALRTYMARKAQWEIPPPPTKEEMTEYRKAHGL